MADAVTVTQALVLEKALLTPHLDGLIDDAHVDDSPPSVLTIFV